MMELVYVLASAAFLAIAPRSPYIYLVIPFGEPLAHYREAFLSLHRAKVVFDTKQTIKTIYKAECFRITAIKS